MGRASLVHDCPAASKAFHERIILSQGICSRRLSPPPRPHGHGGSGGGGCAESHILRAWRRSLRSSQAALQMVVPSLKLLMCNNVVRQSPSPSFRVATKRSRLSFPQNLPQEGAHVMAAGRRPRRLARVLLPPVLPPALRSARPEERVARGVLRPWSVLLASRITECCARGTLLPNCGVLRPNCAI